MKSFRERDPLKIGIVSIAILGLMALLAFEFKKLPFIANTYTLTAEFADAAGLNPNNEVRVAGIKVGRVTRVELAKDRVLVSMAISSGVEIPKDATAEISLKTILGTKFVVIGARGDAPLLHDGGRIPLAQTTIPFEIYQAANAAVDLLTDVDGKLLNQAFDALAGVTADPNRNLARTIEGAAGVLGTLASKRDSLNTLVQKGEDVLASLDHATPDIVKILEHGNVVLQVLAKRRATVQSLLRNTERLATQLSDLLHDNRPELDTILNDLHATLAIVDSSLGQLEEALRILGPSSEAFARITRGGRWASICTMALEAQALPPPLPVSIEIGTPGSGSGPVDCTGLPAATSASASRPSRGLTP